MNELFEDEYFRVLVRYYGKSLILEDPSEFHPTLSFYFFDALAHIEHTLSTYAINYQAPKNMMHQEYMRWRLDEAKKGDRPLFPGFVSWLKANHPERFQKLPMVWRGIYDSDNPASYRSFRIVLDPDSKRPVPAAFFADAVDEFFSREFFNSIYTEGSLGKLFEEYKSSVSA